MCCMHCVSERERKHVFDEGQAVRLRCLCVQAAAVTDPLERMKLVVTFIVAGEPV